MSTCTLVACSANAERTRAGLSRPSLSPSQPSSLFPPPSPSPSLSNSTFLVSSPEFQHYTVPHSTFQHYKFQIPNSTSTNFVFQIPHSTFQVPNSNIQHSMKSVASVGFSHNIGSPKLKSTDIGQRLLSLGEQQCTFHVSNPQISRFKFHIPHFKSQIPTFNTPQSLLRRCVGGV